MSNAFEPTNPTDSCAYCGRARANLWHRVTSDPGTHAFVEPAPQPAPSGDKPVCCDPACRYHGQRHSFLHVAKAAPSGDDAKVREILDRTGWFFEVPRDKAQLVGHDEVLGLLHEAYAAGKADERKACVAIAQEAQRLQAIRRHKSKLVMRAIGDLRDAIARRGSEGK